MATANKGTYPATWHGLVRTSRCRCPQTCPTSQLGSWQRHKGLSNPARGREGRLVTGDLPYSVRYGLRGSRIDSVSDLLAYDFQKDLLQIHSLAGSSLPGLTEPESDE